MPGVTPDRGYPYPLDPDQIDVAGDMQRLAEAVDPDVRWLIDHTPYTIAPVPLNTGNLAEGVLQELGTITLPGSPVDRNWYLAWNWACGGHTADGQLRLRIRSAANVDLAIAGWTPYWAGKEQAGTVTVCVFRAANPTGESVRPYVEIQGTAANTNFRSTAMVWGLAIVPPVIP